MSVSFAHLAVAANCSHFVWLW